MPKSRKQVSTADYAWFGILLMLFFMIVTGGIFLLVKLLWFPIRKHSASNSRVTFVVLSIALILIGLSVSCYQIIISPDGTPLSAKVSVNVIAFIGLSFMTYFLSLFSVFSYEGKMIRALAGKTYVNQPSPITSEQAQRSLAGDEEEDLYFEMKMASVKKASFSKNVSRTEIEHKIWRPLVRQGVAGQKIAIVGYSHYLEENSADTEELTYLTVRAVMDGEQKHSFFTKIRDAFGYSDHAVFWPRVYFFNYLPEAIGDRAQMYREGNLDQYERAKSRFLRFLEQEKPDKVFVFTTKGWKNFPETTLEEQSGKLCNRLGDGPRSPTWGTYQVTGKLVRTCGFQHPQFANAFDLQRHVQKFLEN